MGNGIEIREEMSFKFMSPHYKLFCGRLHSSKWHFKHSFAMIVGFDNLILIAILNSFIVILTKKKSENYRLSSIHYSFSPHC